MPNHNSCVCFCVLLCPRGFHSQAPDNGIWLILWNVNCAYNCADHFIVYLPFLYWPDDLSACSRNSVKTVFDLFYRDQSTFNDERHKENGNTNVNMTKWYKHPKFGFVRWVIQRWEVRPSEFSFANHALGMFLLSFFFTSLPPIVTSFWLLIIILFAFPVVYLLPNGHSFRITLPFVFLLLDVYCFLIILFCVWFAYPMFNQLNLNHACLPLVLSPLPLWPHVYRLYCERGERKNNIIIIIIVVIIIMKSSTSTTTPTTMSTKTTTVQSEREPWINKPTEYIKGNKRSRCPLRVFPVARNRETRQSTTHCS